MLKFMEVIKKFIEWLKPFPTWVKCIILCLVAGLILIVSMSCLSACGTPKTIATVQNVNPNSSVTVTLSVSNAVTSTPTIETAPTVNVNDSIDHGSPSL